MEINLLKSSKNATTPDRKTVYSAGFDLYASEDCVIDPGERKLVNTNIQLSIPPGYYGKIESRSSLALSIIDVSAGVIDSDYRGDIKVLLVNNRKFDYLQDNRLYIKTGMRIAQLIFLKHETPIFKEVSVLDETVRGDRGFGSTGK
jgi:dUTP pyrophosphatase